MNTHIMIRSPFQLIIHSPNHSITYIHPLSHIHPMKHISIQPYTRSLIASRKMYPRKASHGTRIMKARAATTVRKGLGPRFRRHLRLLPPIATPPRRPWVDRDTSGTPASHIPRWPGATVTSGKAGRLQSAGSRLVSGYSGAATAAAAGAVPVVICSHQ